jgi:hypothetical protein
MNQTLIRSILKIGAGFLVAKGFADDSTAEIIVAGLAALIGVLWGVFHRAPVVPAPNPAPVEPGKPPQNPPVPIVFLLSAIGAGLLLTSCRALAPGGAYQGDQVLYHAELTAITAYDVIHTFVKWEHENRAALAVWPEVKQAADTMRKGAPQWFKSAYALRDAYAAAPTAENRAALEKALAVLRSALNEAAGYLARAAEKPN